MKMGSRTLVSEPTRMMHHVREIQLRLLAIGVVAVAGMVLGYIYYEPLFALIKAPLGGPLHYLSPAGSFNFVVKVCLLIGVIVGLPMAVYQAIMFTQPALKERLSRKRVYGTALFSLVLAGGGAAFAYLVIIPMALRFFHKFQVDGLVAMIAADDYLRFVINVVITFALIFQLPLIISLIDHIKPLSPKKLFKAEKFIIVGSVLVGVLVPFALDPLVQLLIASPIIILYNLAIGIVLLQQTARRRALRRNAPSVVKEMLVQPLVSATLPDQAVPVRSPVTYQPQSAAPTATRRTITDFRPASGSIAPTGPLRNRKNIQTPPRPTPYRTRLISDIRVGSQRQASTQRLSPERDVSV